MDILVNVVNQKLKITTNLKNFVAGTQNFVKFRFNLSNDWNNLKPFAQFTQNGKSYNQYLDENDSVYLPSEIQAGNCTLILYGASDETIATTNYLTLSIDNNIYVKDAHSTEISKDLYSQLVTEFQGKVDELENWFKNLNEETINETAKNEMTNYLKSGKLDELIAPVVEKAEDSATNASSAAEKANQAAEKANQAAEDASQAAVGASKVNISMVSDDSKTGATISVTDREGVNTSFHINTLMAVETWDDIKNAIRLGLGESLFPVGYEFTIKDTTTNNDIVWVVRGHNQHKPANNKLNNTMTLETKYVFNKIPFDEKESLYYVSEILNPPRICKFTLKNIMGTINTETTYYFKINEQIPKGGQIVCEFSKDGTPTKILTYNEQGNTNSIEEITLIGTDQESLTSGNNTNVTDLGTIEGDTNAIGDNLNCLRRIIYGSDNYAQSAIRQWLNSTSVNGEWWKPTNRFDRKPNGIDNIDGFMRHLPTDFLNVVQPAIVPCLANSKFEINSTDGTKFAINETYDLKDRFFLLSRGEIEGSYHIANYKDGEQLKYYEDSTSIERIKYSVSSDVITPISSWIRTPSLDGVRPMVISGTNGGICANVACYLYGVTPACIIA